MAYLPSKLLPLAVLPLGLSLILLVVGLIGRWRWPVLTALFLLWVFSLGLVSQGLWRWLEAPWQRRAATAAPRADAIVVLSGGRHPAPGAAALEEWVGFKPSTPIETVVQCFAEWYRSFYGV